MNAVGAVEENRIVSKSGFVVTLIASIACFATICLWLSAHRMMWGDEFDAWNLIADPSWKHALQSWNAGADGGPPLYYAIGRIIVAIAGPHPLALRLYSVACFWLAAFVWTQILRRYFGGVIAVAATAFAFLCSFEFIDQFAQVRFYGQLVLAFSLAVWVALWLERRQSSGRSWFGWSLAAGVFLVLSHPLGVIYNAAIALARLLSRTQINYKLSSFAGIIASSGALLIFLSGLKSGAATTNWLGVPHLPDLIHFYDNHPLLLAHARYVSVLLNLALLCLIAYACAWFLRNRGSKSPHTGLWTLFCISALLMLTPVAFLVASHLYKPLFLARYMLPYNLGFATLAAAGARLLTQRFATRRPTAFALLLGIPLTVIAFLTVKEQALYPPARLESLLRLAQSTPVVFEYGNEVPQAHYYFPSRSANVFFVLPRLKPGERTTLHSIMQQGYEPEIVLDNVFLQQHHDFLYIETQPPSAVFENFLDDPHWKSSDAGTVDLGGVNLPVIRYTRVD